jgi:transposase
MKRNRCQVILPLDLGIKINENDPVRKMVEICEELDYTKLYKEYYRTYRKLSPETMFELLVCAYMNGIYSSRDIEKSCENDIRFMWILQNETAPDHSTIARFQNEKLVNVVEDLFYQLAEKLLGLGEISYKNVFVDGTKIEANANRYSFVWSKAVEKQLDKLNIRISEEVHVIAFKYGITETASLEECLTCLLNQAQLLNIKFVYGRGTRKTELQRDIEKLSEWKKRKEQYNVSTGIFKGRKSYSKTDHDATFMRMKDDHMGNGQLKPGYNVQIAVESEYIVGLGLFSNPTDTTTLLPFIERIQRHTRRKIVNLVADAGYASEENYTYLEKNGQLAYIKPADYEVKKSRKFKKNIYRVENLQYDAEQDCYLCPNNRKLVYTHGSNRKSNNCFIATTKNYICESCEGCPHREKCYAGSYKNRKISISRTFNRQKQEATKLITSNEGQLLRMNRSIQVEGAFGVLKEDYGFRRFLTRGKQKTETQFFLLAIAFNIQKLCNRIESNRFGKSLFEKMTA